MSIPALRLSSAAALAAVFLVACQSTARVPDPTVADQRAATERHVVQVTAEDYAFDAPERIASGWTTLRFGNEGEETHFVVLHRMPEGKGYDDYMLEVVEPFNEVWYPLRDGAIDQGEAIEMLGEKMPAWFWTVEPMGGVGLLAPGRTEEVTLLLEPGEYLLECYMKTAEEGEFHGTEGMVRPMTVTAERSGAPEPTADVRITLSNDGIRTAGEVTSGRETVAIRIAEHPDNGLVHDLHLVRLDTGPGIERLVPFMSWLNVDGLQNPSPFTFLGGTQEMPVGHTAYITLDLEPGRYAWVSEATAAQGMVKEFTVTR